MSKSITAFDALISLSVMSWRLAQIGWKRRWLSAEQVGRIAEVLYTSCNEKHQQELIAMLAYPSSLTDEEIANYITTLSEQEPVPSRDPLKLWQLAKIIGVVHSTADWEAKVDDLDYIFSDLNYPQDMQPCIRYGSGRDPVLEARVLIADLLKSLRIVESDHEIEQWGGLIDYPKE